MRKIGGRATDFPHALNNMEAWKQFLQYLERRLLAIEDAVSSIERGADADSGTPSLAGVQIGGPTTTQGGIGRPLDQPPPGSLRLANTIRASVGQVVHLGPDNALSLADNGSLASDATHVVVAAAASSIWVVASTDVPIVVAMRQGRGEGSFERLYLDKAGNATDSTQDLFDTVGNRQKLKPGVLYVQEIGRILEPARFGLCRCVLRISRPGSS